MPLMRHHLARIIPIALFAGFALLGCSSAPAPAPICGQLQSSDDVSAHIRPIQDNAPGSDFPTAINTAERQVRETCPDLVYKVDQVRDAVGS